MVTRKTQQPMVPALLSSGRSSDSAPATESAGSEAALTLALHQTRPGEVLSYSELARRAGRPRGARWAARWLSQLPVGHDLPWYRVLRADGRIAFPADSSGYREQAARLRAEGVRVVDGRVQTKMARAASLDAWVFGAED